MKIFAVIISAMLLTSVNPKVIYMQKTEQSDADKKKRKAQFDADYAALTKKDLASPYFDAWLQAYQAYVDGTAPRPPHKPAFI